MKIIIKSNIESGNCSQKTENAQFQGNCRITKSRPVTLLDAIGYKQGGAHQ